MISIDVINSITINELLDANNNPVFYAAPQTVILSDFYEKSEISAAASLQTAITGGDADLFVNGIQTNDLNDAGTAPVQSVNTELGAVVIDATDVGADPAGTAATLVGNHEAAADPHANYETSTQLNARDSANRNRANHTGTQTASTISDFDTEVANNSAVAANTAKNSYPAADASKLAGIEAGAEVNQTDAEIKTQYENNANTNEFNDEEKRKVNGSASFGSSVSINVNQVTPAIIPLDTSLDNNAPGLTIGPNDGLVIPANYAGNWAVEWKFTFDFTNRSDISGGIDINNTGVILPITVAPTYNTRNANNPAGSAVCGWVPIGSLAVGDEVILKAFRAGIQAGNVPSNAGETVLTLHYLGT